MKFLIMMIVLMSGCIKKSESQIDSGVSVEAEVEIILGIHDDADCSHGIGDNPCNFILKDQSDEYWELYESAGFPIVLDFSAMWCGPCQSAALEADEIQSDYSSYGLQYVTVLLHNSSMEDPDLKDVQSWVLDAGIEITPVLQGSYDMVDFTSEAGYPVSAWPTFVFINRAMEIHHGMYGWNEETVRKYVEEIL